jgi:hypothetical protein
MLNDSDRVLDLAYQVLCISIEKIGAVSLG